MFLSKSTGQTAVGVLVLGITALKRDAERNGEWWKSSHRGNVEDFSLRRKAMDGWGEKMVPEHLLGPTLLTEANLSLA